MDGLTYARPPPFRSSSFEAVVAGDGNPVAAGYGGTADEKGGKATLLFTRKHRFFAGEVERGG